MKNVIIWGTGGRTEYYIDQGYFNEVEIVAFADNDLDTQIYKGKKVLHSEEIANGVLNVDFIVICSKAYLEILKQCIGLHIDWNKIALTDNNDDLLCQELFGNLRSVSRQLYEKLAFSKYIHTKRNEYDKDDTEIRIGTGIYEKEEYMNEYFRFRTFEYMAQELQRNNVIGAVAELGVFRGTFSILINDIFKDRKLYLFDTFEGFDLEESKKEIEKGHTDNSFVEAHKHGDEELVKALLPHPENCVFCKGFFPNSIPDNAYDECFAFVSIDVDFEESTYQGLKFFYPRLSERGAIFVHDYHAIKLEGVRNAVSRYETDFEVKLKYVPLADRAGTIVIIK